MIWWYFCFLCWLSVICFEFLSCHKTKTLEIASNMTFDPGEIRWVILHRSLHSDVPINLDYAFSLLELISSQDCITLCKSDVKMVFSALLLLICTSSWFLIPHYLSPRNYLILICSEVTLFIPFFLQSIRDKRCTRVVLVMWILFAQKTLRRSIEGHWWILCWPVSSLIYIDLSLSAIMPIVDCRNAIWYQCSISVF